MNGLAYNPINIGDGLIENKYSIPHHLLEKIPLELRDNTDRSKLNEVFDTMRIRDLFGIFENSKSPVMFKESLLRIAQLYFDGVIKFKLISRTWEEQQKTQGVLFDALGSTLIGFYQNNNVEFSEARELLLPVKPQILYDASPSFCKHRHLIEEESKVRKFIKNLDELVEDNHMDLVIPISSGGFEPGILAAKHLKVSEILPIRYSCRDKFDSKIHLPRHAPWGYVKNKIRNKKVLVIDDIMETGNTIFSVEEWVRKYSPKEVYSKTVRTPTHAFY